jgi:uncharacterized protein (TIGR02145 family)
MRCGYNQYGLIKIPIKKACSGYFLRWYYNGWHYWFFLPGTLTINTEGEKYRTIGTRKIAMNSGQITRGQSDAIRTIVHTREVYLLTAIGWMNIRIEPGTLNIYDSRIAGGEIEFIAIIGSRELSLSGYSPVADVPVISPSTGYCEVVIGTQIWMCKNWDSNWPGSKVYNDDEANRLIYGGMYNFNQINSPGFCPDGWDVPTEDEWDTMINYIGGAAVAGGKLKEVGTSHWDAPNTGATDDYGFAALPTGYFATTDFLNMGAYGYYWTKNSLSESMARAKQLGSDTASVSNLNWPKSFFIGVRLIKNIGHTMQAFNDWFLPSKDELNEMYEELHLHGVGGFTNNEYWSSTEESGMGGYHGAFQQFLGGGQSSAGKGGVYHVRACRAFMSITNYNLRDIGPSGGRILWKSGNDYLEAAPSDQSTSQVWSNINNIEIGVTAQGTAIGTGKANTAAIIAQVGHTDSAAKLCDDLIIYH